jgi:hypothetical protein
MLQKLAESNSRPQKKGTVTFLRTGPNPQVKADPLARRGEVLNT